MQRKCITFALVLTRSISAYLVCYGFFGFVDDRGWTYSQNLARGWVDAELGTTSKYVQGLGLVMNDAERWAALQSLIDDGCDLIVTGSATLLQLTQEFAVRYPDRHFVCLSGDVELDNMGGVDVRVYQAYYLCGAIAGLHKINTWHANRSLGYVGSIYAPDSLRNVNAFYLGARSVGYSGPVYMLHTGSWYDTRMERIAGLRLMHWYNVDVIAYDSDSIELAQLAKTEGRYSISAKIDGTSLFGESNLASTVYVWNDLFVSFVEAAMHKEKGQILFHGYDRDAVSLGTLSVHVDAITRLHVAKEIQQFRKGNDTIFCPLEKSFTVACPAGASEIANSNGALTVPATSIWPCNTSIVNILPPNGESCLSDSQLRSMSYFFNGIIDLGLQKVPVECPAGTRMDALNPSLCVECNPGTYTGTADLTECSKCPAGKAIDRRNATACLDCSPGFFRAISMQPRTCEKCPRGSFTEGYGAIACALCIPGTFNDHLHGTCQLCDLGSFANTSGQSSCMPCPANSDSHSVGSDSCMASVGYFQNPPWVFRSCGGNKITRYPGAKSNLGCICPRGHYFLPDANACLSCPEGLDCIGDSRNLGDTPFTTAPGFHAWYMHNQTAAIVFRCVPLELCRGRDMCNSGLNSDMAACGECLPGHYRSGNNCKTCTDEDIVFAIATFSIAVCLFCVIIRFMNGSVLNMSLFAKVEVGMAGIMTSALQAMSVFSQMSIPWVEPLSTMFRILATLTLNIDVLRVTCLLRGALEHPSNSYIRRIGCMTFATFCAVGVTALKPYLLRRRLQWKRFRREVKNTLGTLYVIFFIALCIVTFLPFQCYQHPTPGYSSVVAYPQILCWRGGPHNVLLSLCFCVMLLVLVPGLAWCIWATSHFPRAAILGDEAFLQSTSFLFARMKPSCYRWSLPMATRGLFIVIVITFFPSYAELQIMFSSAIVISSGGLVAYVKPWRLEFCNYFDAGVSAMLVMFLLCGAVLIDVPSTSARMQYAGSALLAVGVMYITASAGYGVLLRFRPNPMFLHFICHHKACEGGQARLVQMLLEAFTGGSCFIDADHLVDLNALFDAVRSCLKNMIVYLGRETMTRPWCVGEMATAHASGVKMIVIRTDVFLPFQNTDIDTIQDVLGSSGIEVLLTHGVDMDMVQEALEYVQSSPAISLPASARAQHFFMLVGSILKESISVGKVDKALLRGEHQSTTPGGLSVPSTKTSVSTLLKAIYICVDFTDNEAISSCIILSRLLRKVPDLAHAQILSLADTIEMEIHRNPLLYTIDRDNANQILILSKAVLSSASCAVFVHSCMMNDASVIPVSIPGFDFPSTDACDHICSITAGKIEAEYVRWSKRSEARYDSWLSEPFTDKNIRGDTLARAFMAVFDVIAVQLSLHAKLTIINAEVLEVRKRMSPDSKTVVYMRSSPSARSGMSSVSLNVDQRWNRQRDVASIGYMDCSNVASGSNSESTTCGAVISNKFSV